MNSNPLLNVFIGAVVVVLGGLAGYNFGGPATPSTLFRVSTNDGSTERVVFDRSGGAEMAPNSSPPRPHQALANRGGGRGGGGNGRQGNEETGDGVVQGSSSVPAGTGQQRSGVDSAGAVVAAAAAAGSGKKNNNKIIHKNRERDSASRDGGGGTPTMAAAAAAGGGGNHPYPAVHPERCASAEYRHGMRRKRKKKEYGSVSAIYDSPDQIAARKGYVHLDCRGQWGNHLGQYAVARIVAEELNFGLWVCPTLLDENWKKGHIFPQLGELAFDAASMQGLEEVDYGKHAYHLPEMVHNSTPRKLHMWGYPFDDFWLFGEYRNRIREFFKLDVGCIYWNQSYPEPEDVVVHVRGYNCHNDASIKAVEKLNFDPTESFADPPFEYYQAILEKMKTEQGGWRKLWVASRCGLLDPVAARIAKEFGAVLTPSAEVHGDMADFLFLSASKRLIMSQSTFAWWAAFLGGGEREVHYPLVGEWWGKRPRHRLYPEEARYVFHDLYETPFKMFLSREQIQPGIDALKPVW